GPCRIPDDNGMVFHPQSWNSNANIFFIDQPVGVGFSYAEYGEAVVCCLSYVLYMARILTRRCLVEDDHTHQHLLVNEDWKTF
ncbi:hypothetical protein BD779DRAFT_1451543, partial [Infundibulicybe gibba]